METINIQLDNYILEEEIGRGDLTAVYRAARKSDGAVVAVKIVASQLTYDELFVKRFQDAASHAARLEHPNIVQTYEADFKEGTLYVVRELIEARTLAQLLEDEGPLPRERMLTIARQIAAALDYAHQKSIMHGDLSANRIYIGSNDHTTIADFGQMQAMAKTSLVKQGFAVGSPEIMAPERVKGQGPSRQSDLYSLGVICYQMLAEEPPFSGSPTAVLHAQAYEQPRPLHLVNPHIPVALSETIGRMLSKGLELRYITGAEFTRALSVAVKGTAPMKSPAAAAAQAKAAGLESTSLWRRFWVWAVVVIPLLLILLGLGFWLVSLWNTLQTGAATTEEISTLDNSAPISTPTSTAPATSVVVAITEQESSVNENTEESSSLISPTETPMATPSPTPLPTSSPTSTPTQAPLPTPGPPVIAEDSPFTNLLLAHDITEDNQPQQVGTSFAPGSRVIYLFFDYQDIEPGTSWIHRWTWGDTELGTYQEVWPDSYEQDGTAWVFYLPAGGYEPGPYKVTLEIEGTTVATATFVIQPGGL